MVCGYFNNALSLAAPFAYSCPQSNSAEMKLKSHQRSRVVGACIGAVGSVLLGLVLFCTVLGSGLEQSSYDWLFARKPVAVPEVIRQKRQARERQQNRHRKIDEYVGQITFPRGLAKYTSSGTKTNQTVFIEVEYAPAGTSSWVNAGTTSPAIQVTAKQSTAIRQGLRVKVTRGKYDVRLRRITADSTSDTTIDESVWTALRSIRNESPIKLSGLAVTVLRIKARIS